MGKIKPRPAIRDARHAPLAQQLVDDQAPTKRRRKVKQDDDADSRQKDGRVDARMLDLARAQLEEIAAEARDDLGEGPSRSAFAAEEDDEEEEDDMGSEEELEYEEIEIDEDDAAALEAFMPSRTQPRMLADLVMEKIEEHEFRSEAKAMRDQAGPDGFQPLSNPKVIEVYTKVGHLLSRYRSGPLPKAFKILPTLPYWPSLVELTNTDKWTPNALFAATRIFAAQLDAKGCQKFYRGVLLDRVREEIAETKKLSVHTYGALKIALRKPAGFFKGILFPLCQSGTCTLREAAIIGSVLQKVSVPVLHSGAALLRLADMEYSGPNSLYIRVLLDKKYALPYKVVDALVFHFIRFRRDARDMPVLWHQSLLVFAQRYKNDLTEEQRDSLLELLKYKTHDQITPEVRRELASAINRGEADPNAMKTDTWV